MWANKLENKNNKGVSAVCTDAWEVWTSSKMRQPFLAGLMQLSEAREFESTQKKQFVVYHCRKEMGEDLYAKFLIRQNRVLQYEKVAIKVVRPAALRGNIDTTNGRMNIRDWIVRETSAEEIILPRTTDWGYVAILVPAKEAAKAKQFLATELVKVCRVSARAELLTPTATRIKISQETGPTKSYMSALCANVATNTTDQPTSPPIPSKKSFAKFGKTNKTRDHPVECNNEPSASTTPEVAAAAATVKDLKKTVEESQVVCAEVHPMLAAVKLLLEPLLTSIEAVESDIAKIMKMLESSSEGSPVRKRRDACSSPKATHDRDSDEDMCHSPASSDLFGGSECEPPPSGIELFPAEEHPADELNLTIEFDTDSVDHPDSGPVRADQYQPSNKCKSKRHNERPAPAG